MSVRDQILSKVATETREGFKSEPVSIPEWDDLKIVVRQLSIGDRNAYLSRGRKFIETDDGKIKVAPNDDPNAQIYLAVLSAYEEDGVTRLLLDSDVEELAKGGEKTDAALDRIVKVAVKLSNLLASADEVEEAVDEAGKDSSPTETDSLSTS